MEIFWSFVVILAVYVAIWAVICIIKMIIDYIVYFSWSKKKIVFGVIGEALHVSEHGKRIDYQYEFTLETEPEKTKLIYNSASSAVKGVSRTRGDRIPVYYNAKKNTCRDVVKIKQKRWAGPLLFLKGLKWLVIWTIVSFVIRMAALQMYS